VDFYFADTSGFSLGSFDTIKDIVNIALASDIITRAGAFYSYGGERWQGKEKVLDAVREDLDLQRNLRNEVFTHYGIQE
jgi:hypothetical protein